jgi:hypothetical protein
MAVTAISLHLASFLMPPDCQSYFVTLEPCSPERTHQSHVYLWAVVAAVLAFFIVPAC